jgi:Mrp family chromosome partitioning ATPase
MSSPRSLLADSVAHEFRLLRNRIEAEIHAPALVFVTSATDEDGSGFAAHGIASALSRTHQRTVLVTSDPSFATPPKPEIEGTLSRRASDRITVGDRPSHNGGFSVVCLSPERVATISRSRVAEMVQELRTSNDYVVVDGGNLAKNGLGLLLVGSADVAIVAFRGGRVEAPEDRLMLDALERAESKVIGVVMTDQDAIDHFAQRDAAPEPAAAVVPEPKRAAVLKRIELVLSRLGRSS